MTEHNAMTLVIPLKAKDGVALRDFYDYWLNAHVTLPPRFPGISSVCLDTTSLADSLWPAVDGVSMRPDEEDTIDGVPEATFPTMNDLQAFIKASRVQMEDGINFLSQEIGYAGLGPNSTTVRDSTDPAPDGTDTHVRHLVFLRKRPHGSSTPPSTRRRGPSWPGARPCTRRACSAASPPSTTGGSRSPGCAAWPWPTSSASSARPARPRTTSPASSCPPPT